MMCDIQEFFLWRLCCTVSCILDQVWIASLNMAEKVSQVLDDFFRVVSVRTSMDNGRCIVLQNIVSLQNHKRESDTVNDCAARGRRDSILLHYHSA